MFLGSIVENIQYAKLLQWNECIAVQCRGIHLYLVPMCVYALGDVHCGATRCKQVIALYVYAPLLTYTCTSMSRIECEQITTYGLTHVPLFNISTVFLKQYIV
jgi:hypothetical protein